MFKKVTQSIVKQMDPGGDLVPVHSILDHEHFQPLCLLRRKRKAKFQPFPRYRQTWYRLEDLLLPGRDDKGTGSHLPTGSTGPRQFTVQKSSSDRVDGSLNLCLDSASVELKGAASSSQGWAIKLQKNHIPVPQLDALMAERKVNVNHSFVQQLQRTRQDLYVVHETIETSEEATYEESTEAEGSFMAQLYAKFCAKGTRESKQSITIPKGCTLAFRAIQLATAGGRWDLKYFPRAAAGHMFLSDGLSEGELGALQSEVKENCQILSELSSDQRAVFLKAIKAVMTDRNLFQELAHKMDAVLNEDGGCELTTESPDLKALLSSLQNSSGPLLKLARAVAYTLDALDELTEDQLLLLLESLEEKVVPQQLKLVASILEQDVEGKECWSLATSLLSLQPEEERELTVAMVQRSRVTLQKDGAAVCTEEASLATAALYVSLYALDLLSNSDQ
ncbi:PREDICTED: gasdermin-A-like [Merops nubicus]|uniref:gasdermin-A-like n=1 Tax=Merops nubicus TaxID=57421 RepID=UPI0004F0A88C|nr:PREDICTED: gasdermin-A-like [Merops nubicus]